MKIHFLKNILSFIAASAVTFCFLPMFSIGAEVSERTVFIDGNTASLAENTLFEGLGAVTGSGSSSLLRDYKLDHPDEYREIMDLLFKKGYGAGLCHVKVEMGSDVNSSSGTEPSIMRNDSDIPDITRCAGWQFAADAKKINPDITVDMIRWGEPRWVTDAFTESAESGYAARYKWYKAHLDAAYDVYGLKLDCISADASETDSTDPDWIIYLSDKLRSEKSEKYDYSKIKIAASDEIGTWDIADKMLSDPKLRDAVDIITCHYNTRGTEATSRLLREYGKQLRYSEGDAPLNVSEYSVENGLCGEGFPLDTANEIIDMYCLGKMTMYEYHPAAAAYYSGTKYFPKGLITANTPWNGSFICEDGLWISAHFTRFTDKCRAFVNSACAGSGTGEKGSDHYLTLTDSEKKDLAIIITNDSETVRNYNFVIMNMTLHTDSINVVETTCGNYLQKCGTIKLKKENGNLTFGYSLNPGSIVTLTTEDIDLADTPKNIPENTVLALPYSEDFDHSDDISAPRGNSPMYMCTQGGAFEITDGKLDQVITNDIKPFDRIYKSTPLPCVSFGDDRWADYKVSADITLANDSDDNFAGLGIRYNSAVTDEDSAVSGYILSIHGNGSWELAKADSLLAEGRIEDFDAKKTYRLEIEALGRKITARINGNELCSITESGSFANSGRISLRSAYFRNSFDNIRAEAVSATPYITRIDVLDRCMDYSGNHTSDAMSSYRFRNRTCAVSDTETVMIPVSEFTSAESLRPENGSLWAKSEKASAVIEFEGDLISVVGAGLKNSKAFLDGKIINSEDFSDGTITVSSNSKNRIHSLKLLLPEDSRIDFAFCGSKPQESSFRFGYTGGGFSLTGENTVPAIAEITADGDTETVMIPETLSREAYYSRELPFGEHEITVNVICGSITTDTAEIRSTNDIAAFAPDVGDASQTSELSLSETTVGSNEQTPDDPVKDTADPNAAVTGAAFSGIISLLAVFAASAAERGKNRKK